MTKWSFLLVAVTVVLIVACSPGQAWADAIYSYNGPPYFTPTSAYYQGDHLSILVDLSAVLSSPTLSAVNPLFWSVSDGVNTFTSIDCKTDTCTTSFNFGVDGQGNVTEWGVTASISGFGPLNASVSVNSGFFCPTGLCGDQIDVAHYQDAVTTASARSQHQTSFNPLTGQPWWTQVPEPDSLSLLLFGLAGFGYWIFKFGS